MDLNKIVQKTLPLLKSATSGFYRNYNFSPDELIVEVDIQLLQQVIFNLVNNACQAMGESGELSIISLKSENKAVLEVRDNGPGISKEIIDKVFDPFFTTKKQGEGTGLGLSLSKSIVESFGGRLVLDQAFVDGARFLLELPLKKDET